VFLGDYIDRGPDSKKVVELILQLKKDRPHVITLLGNHEYMLLNYLAGLDNSLFLQVGGRQTLTSYDLPPEMQPVDVCTHIPQEHLSFFYDLPLLWEDQHGIYVHAGLQPGLHISRQTNDWCLWVRDEFIRSSYNFGKPVVFGHTVFKKPLVQKNKIGIDTGAVYGQTLTGLLLPEMEFVSVHGEQEHPYPMPL
jgi:serine/threonine protein phosphatase 1